MKGRQKSALSFVFPSSLTLSSFHPSTLIPHPFMYCPACGHDKNPPGADACANCGLALTHLDAPAPNGPVEASLANDPVSVLDPRPPITVALDATLGDAVRQMIAGRTGAVLVTGPNGELVGILTERDFLTKV